MECPRPYQPIFAVAERLPYALDAGPNTLSVLSSAWICWLTDSSSVVKSARRASSASIFCYILSALDQLGVRLFE